MSLTWDAFSNNFLSLFPNVEDRWFKISYYIGFWVQSHMSQLKKYLFFCSCCFLIQWDSINFSLTDAWWHLLTKALTFTAIKFMNIMWQLIPLWTLEDMVYILIILVLHGSGWTLQEVHWCTLAPWSILVPTKS